MVSRPVGLEVELCSTTRGLPVPSLTLTPAKLNPYSCGVVPLWAPPWLLGKWGKVGELRERFHPCRALRTRPLNTGTGYPAEFKREPSTTSRDFGTAVQDLHGRSGRLVETPQTTTPTTTLPLPRVAS